ncbi:MAG: hypothetical protein ABI459_04575 [Deltaproteobacteria bacterium]
MVKPDSWAKHCWTQARAELLPTLPLEIIRIRVARARAIGLEYSTYATIRATTGRDIIAFLYSSESLRVRPVSLDLPLDRAARLRDQDADKLLFAARDMRADRVAIRFAEQGIDLAGIAPSPAALGSWSDARTAIRAALDPLKLPGDAVVMVGEGSLQKDWAEAGKLASFLAADRFFGDAA